MLTLSLVPVDGYIALPTTPGTKKKEGGGGHEDTTNKSYHQPSIKSSGAMIEPRTVRLDSLLWSSKISFCFCRSNGWDEERSLTRIQEWRVTVNFTDLSAVDSDARPVVSRNLCYVHIRNEATRSKLCGDEEDGDFARDSWRWQSEDYHLLHSNWTSRRLTLTYDSRQLFDGCVRWNHHLVIQIVNGVMSVEYWEKMWSAYAKQILPSFELQDIATLIIQSSAAALPEDKSVSFVVRIPILPRLIDEEKRRLIFWDYLLTGGMDTRQKHKAGSWILFVLLRNNTSFVCAGSWGILFGGTK